MNNLKPLTMALRVSKLYKYHLINNNHILKIKKAAYFIYPGAYKKIKIELYTKKAKYYSLID